MEGKTSFILSFLEIYKYWYRKWIILLFYQIYQAKILGNTLYISSLLSTFIDQGADGNDTTKAKSFKDLSDIWGSMPKDEK